MAKYIKCASVLRRFIFAASFLPADYPDYIGTLCRFAVLKSSHPPLDVAIAKVLLDNLKMLENTAFVSDLELKQQIIVFPRISGEETGITLLPQESNCIQCGTALLLRSDRPSPLSLYTEMGTVPAYHYHKYCPNRKTNCKTVYYYGFNSTPKGIYYSEKWNYLKYMISSQETAFELNFLRKFDAELLIGQVSYSQKADIYNYQNGYDSPSLQSNSSNQQRFAFHLCSIIHSRKCIFWSGTCTSWGSNKCFVSLHLL